jgi:hypothetical protein
MYHTGTRNYSAICVLFAGTIWPFLAQARYSIWYLIVGIYVSLTCLDMKHDWTDGTEECWSWLLVYAIVPLVLTRCLNTFQKLVFNMYFISKSTYTSSIEFVLAQVRDVPVKYDKNSVILNYRTLLFTVLTHAHPNDAYWVSINHSWRPLVVRPIIESRLANCFRSRQNMNFFIQ